MINFLGIASVVIFYLLILAVGLWAARKNTGGSGGTTQEEEVMLAGRNIGMFVGIFTMTATWVGGGYINGTSEIIFTSGLIWCQAPLGYALSLVFGGMLFANPMRKEGYVTMLDPLQDCFGSRMGGLLFIPALCGEVFWSAGILAALGATLAIIIKMDLDAAVIMSALIAIGYTWIGGLYSVAYTDVVQLWCIFIGLVMCIPFAWVHPAVEPITLDSQDWIGSVKSGWEWYYMDYMLLLTFGGIPWQVYFQRVLSSQTARGAQLLSYIAAFGCLAMAIPPILLGAIAKSTDWTKTDYDGTLPIPPEDVRMILPMVLQYLTPSFVSFFGLGAVSAAVMSSADSSVLSASSMFARNVYKLIFRQHASENEVLWVMRISIFVVGGMATGMALTIPTIYGLWAMCSDLVYVILFPQLLIVVHFRRWCNTYGSLTAYCVGMFFRLAGGENLIHLPPLIKYPMYDEESNTQLFPFRTFAMLLSMSSLIIVSSITRYLFVNQKLSLKYDIFNCFTPIPISGILDDNSLLVVDPNSAMQIEGSATKTSSSSEKKGLLNSAGESDETPISPTTYKSQHRASIVLSSGMKRRALLNNGASLDVVVTSPSAAIASATSGITTVAAIIAAKSELNNQNQKQRRKPDPDIRELRRQLSFGSGLISTGSLKRRQQENFEQAPRKIPPVLMEENSKVEDSSEINNIEMDQIGASTSLVSPKQDKKQQHLHGKDKKVNGDECC